MITPTGLDELGTDELHASMAVAVSELSEEHPVRVLWERLDEILTAGGPECLPAPWDEYSEPDHEELDATAAATPDEIQDCRCVEFCNEDPKTACRFSGCRHVHPASQGSGFGPCPVHPDASGDV